MLRTCSGVQLRKLRQIVRSLTFSVLSEGTQLVTSGIRHLISCKHSLGKLQDAQEQLGESFSTVYEARWVKSFVRSLQSISRIYPLLLPQSNIPECQVTTRS
jgi:hypothetical protein